MVILPRIKSGVFQDLSNKTLNSLLFLMNTYYVYIMTNPLKTVLYIGVTNSLLRRVLEHKQHFNQKSFTSRYNLTKLVYFEIFEKVYDAIAREKQLKRWHREWKESLISEVNNSWRDLSLEWEEMKSGMALIKRS